MRCWRVNVRKNFSRYLNGELAAPEVKRIEDHLLDCGECRTRLARIRTGHGLAGQVPRLTPQRDGWSAIEKSIEAERTNETAEAREEPPMSRPVIVIRPASAAVAVTIACAIIVFAVVVVTNRQSSSLQGETGLLADALQLRDFHPVTIAGIERNTKPHIVAEGYVSQVSLQDASGDCKFKLVETLQKQEPFIICEIIDPIKFEPPRVGSRVRVYGVSRYDPQDDHKWYEVHPVLNIEVVR